VSGQNGAYIEISPGRPRRPEAASRTANDEAPSVEPYRSYYLALGQEDRRWFNNLSQSRRRAMFA